MSSLVLSHAANEVVRRAARIESRFVDGVDASSLDLRKPPPDTELVRLVEVEGFDNQACCGTHPRSSAEVGPIVVRGIEKLKNATPSRVSLWRARAERLPKDGWPYARARERSEQQRRGHRRCSGKAAGRAQGSRKDSSKARKRGFALPMRGLDGGMRHRGAKLPCSPRSSKASGPPRFAPPPRRLTQKPGRVVILGGVEGGRAHIVCARSADVSADGERTPPSGASRRGRQRRRVAPDRPRRRSRGGGARPSPGARSL